MKKLTKILLTTTSVALISSAAPAFAEASAPVDPNGLIGSDVMNDPVNATVLLSEIVATPSDTQITSIPTTLADSPAGNERSTVQSVIAVTGSYDADAIASALPPGATDYLGENALTGKYEINAVTNYEREVVKVEEGADPVDDIITNERLVNLSGRAVVSSEITGMYELTIDIKETDDPEAPVDVLAPTKFEIGSVSTDGILYQYNDQGTSEIDPVTGEVTIKFDSTKTKTTELDVNGLKTTGNVSAADITASGAVTAASVTADLVTTDDVILAGKSLNLTISELQAEFEAQDGVLAGKLTTETNERKAEDVKLTGLITAEETARKAEDVKLADAVKAEETARKAEDVKLAAADVALGARITAEETDRKAADVALAAADVKLQGNIDAEATARIAADTGLGTRITTESNARVAADLAESNARIAADNALGSRITDETNQRIAADNVLRDMIASSTATAIALGGTAILPDANFTLAGNVGFYQGATALSLNAAGRVADKVYLTAAVGGGTNKRGEVGGRVGVVFGF